MLGLCEELAKVVEGYLPATVYAVLEYPECGDLHYGGGSPQLVGLFPDRQEAQVCATAMTFTLSSRFHSWAEGRREFYVGVDRDQDLTGFHVWGQNVFGAFVQLGHHQVIEMTCEETLAFLGLKEGPSSERPIWQPPRPKYSFNASLLLGGNVIEE